MVGSPLRFVLKDFHQKPSPAFRRGVDIRWEGNHLILTVQNESALPEINRYLVTHGASVYEISPKHISLEELFVETVGKEGGL